MQALQQIEEQYAQFQATEACVGSDAQRKMVLALAKDLPRLWNAKTTSAKYRERILRLLIKDITVEKNCAERKATHYVRWQGGVNTDIDLELPAPIADRLSYSSEIVEKVRALAVTLLDVDIAAELNAKGIRSAKDKAFTKAMVSWIRFKHRIPCADLKGSNQLTVDEVMTRFGVSRNVVYYWIERSIVDARQLKRGFPYWIIITEEKEKELRH